MSLCTYHVSVILMNQQQSRVRKKKLNNRKAPKASEKEESDCDCERDDCEKCADVYEIPMVYIAQVVLGGIVSHPFHYAKTLIQLGHEVLPARPGVTITGTPALYFPSVLNYIKFIRKREGIWGLYKGYTYTAANGVVCQRVNDYAYSKLDAYVKRRFELKRGEDEAEGEDYSAENVFKQALQVWVKEGGAKICAILATQPIQVMATRCFAQFVGGEKVYDSWISSIKEIYTNEGIRGFFSGVSMRLLAELSILTVSISIGYTVKYAVQSEQRSVLSMWARSLSTLIIGPFFYPYLLVARIMEANPANLAACRPPYSARYSSVFECYSDLAAEDALKRGSSYFFRKMTNPVLFERYGFMPSPTGGEPVNMLTDGSIRFASDDGLFLSSKSDPYMFGRDAAAQSVVRSAGSYLTGVSSPLVDATKFM